MHFLVTKKVSWMGALFQRMEGMWRRGEYMVNPILGAAALRDI